VTTLLGGLRLQARSFAKAPSFTVTVLLTLATSAARETVSSASAVDPAGSLAAE
jgi:hypothetical protein